MITSGARNRVVDFYDDAALFERLTEGLRSGSRQVVFVAGSALTAPSTPEALGVPGVSGVIDIIRGEFGRDQCKLLDEHLNHALHKYQEAFRFLIGRRGQFAANNVIRQAVARARLYSVGSAESVAYRLSNSTADEVCRSFDNDYAGWFLTPGVEALGRLAAGYPDVFGRTALTTNFDPLIGASVQAAGGTTFRTILHGDGRLGQADGNGYHVVHLHGYWYGSDTLHTPRQLNQPRPQLKASLAHLIRDKIVVVIGYGGWDDAFTTALMDVVVDDSAYPEVVWTFRDEEPNIAPHLIDLLEPGLNRERVTLYKGVDCHKFLPQLVDRWRAIAPPIPPKHALFRDGFRVVSIEPTANSVAESLPFDLGEERPPQVPFYVGRSQEVKILRSSPFRVCFITGIGGQGKSALAGQFFSDARINGSFEHRVWRDCKEENERFENHVVSIVKFLGHDRVAGADIAKQSMADLATIFGKLTEYRQLLVVFDNVDHYVDLELRVFRGAAGEFLEHFLGSNSKARLLFTCRPAIQARDDDSLSLHLEGIDLDSATELFRLRKTEITFQSIDKIHRLTSGHAFWIDLLAAQFARNPSAQQRDRLLEAFSTHPGVIPDATLRSIWSTLQERQQIVLQALAETLRPTTLIQLENYLSSRIKYNQISKAVRTLQDLSLIVVRPDADNLDGFELHPLIRTFIKSTFPREERLWYIDAILKVYAKFFGLHVGSLSGRRTDADTINHWTEGAELYINAGQFEPAFTRLAEIAPQFMRSAPPGEFIRVGELLLEKSDVTSCVSYRWFDLVMSALIRILSNVGRLEKSLFYLEMYRTTIPDKDARYINFCYLQTYVHWRTGSFETAIKWGMEGVELKASSGVDTAYSAEHALALARRDSGDIDEALTVFLGGLSLNDVVDQNHLDRDRGGQFYGNIGRCLQLMGQIEPALHCYQKSAQLIEEDVYDHEENRAFVRQWIGELLYTRGDKVAALNFLVAAHTKWTLISPPKAAIIETAIHNMFNEEVRSQLKSEVAAESFCRRWIALGS